MSPSVPARRESRAERARRLVYRGRFVTLYVLLAFAAGVSIAALVMLLDRGSPAPAPAWSTWEPTGSSERRAVQIGDRVSDGYRLPSGRPLVAVTYAGPPSIAGPEGAPLQIRAIAVQSTAANGAEEIDAYPAGSNVMYILCGLGPACSISEGDPSTDRHQLLRREALEIALYTFRYVEGTQSVLVLLPPRPDAAAATSVFLQRSDVSEELDKPLADTLTPATPALGDISALEGRDIDRLTQPHVYGYQPLQQQDGGVVLVLTPALS